MSYILSCGCKSEYSGFPCEWDSETEECEPCTEFGMLCEKHYHEYDARPAQEYRELNDDEIGAIISEIKYSELSISEYDFYTRFARAIMKRCGIISGTDK